MTEKISNRNHKMKENVPSEFFSISPGPILHHSNWREAPEFGFSLKPKS
jgi:hypothetical protein